MNKRLYNDYAMRQWEKRYTEPPDDSLYDGMTDEELEALADKTDYEEGMLYEKYEMERKRNLGE